MSNSNGIFGVRPREWFRGIIKARGDLVRGGANGRPAQLSLGASGEVVTSDGSDAVYEHPRSAVTGEAKSLIVTNNSGTPASQLDIDADEIVLKTADGGQAKVVSSVNLTADITASGANGLDTGSEATDTWYYAWAIWNPATDTVAGLLSTSATSPTLPSGYTFKALVSAIYNDASGDFKTYWQSGKRIYCEQVDVSNQWQPLDGGAATTITAVDLAAHVPPNATAAQVWFQAARDSAAAAAFTARIFTENSDPAGLFYNLNYLYDGTRTLLGDESLLMPLKTPQTFWYKHDVAGNILSAWIQGFILP